MDQIIHREERLTTKAMIISVGGTPAPVIKTIREHKPEFVSFFASQNSIDHVAKIKSAINCEEFSVTSEVTLADDVNDLLHCHQRAEEAIKRVLLKGFKKEVITVDYTGGTKNMSVALALASISCGFSFSYVGGRERTKDGVGIVVDGQEEVYHNVNPWDFLAIEERKKIAVLFNQYQFKAARELTNSLAGRSTKYKAVFKKMGLLVDGYYMWDLFRHPEAVQLFEKARTDDTLEGEDEAIRDFAVVAKQHLAYLKGNVDAKIKGPSSFLILDLYSNAERRAEEGKVDDAILRLYRVVEMIAQERLLNKYGIDTSNVKADQIPAGLVEEYIRKFKDPHNGVIKVPQAAAYMLLAALEDEIGKLFEANQLRFKDIQSSRNGSYLAHGFRSSTEKTYEKLRDFILGLNTFAVEDAPSFPKIRF